jgi:uncharacterized protein (TIGR00661 family)
VRLAESLLRLELRRFFRDVTAFDASGLDLVITDYEPASGWIARRHRLPSLGLGHLYAFRTPLRLPGVTRPAQLLVHHFAHLYTPVEHTIGLHWHAFGGPNLPPTIAPEVYARPEIRHDKVLVYLPGEQEDEVAALLRRFPRFRFVVYGRRAAAAQMDNVLFRPHDRQAFLDDLADAGGVIANAGFTLASEALHLGRRLLVRPIRRHPEQFLNGRALEHLALGTVVPRLAEDALARWLDSEPPQPMNYPDVVELLAAWIDRGNLERVDELVEEAWSSVTWRPKRAC